MDTPNNEQLQRVSSLAREVITHTRNALFVNLRFMDVALGQLTLEEMPLLPLCTNGTKFFYEPMHVLLTYERSREELARDYLHVVMHCIFCHFYVSPLINRPLWDLACDIAVESAITDLGLDATAAPREANQKAILKAISDEIGPLTAEKVYRYYLDIAPTEEQLHALSALFHADDHLPWYLPDKGTMSGNGDGEGEGDPSRNPFGGTGTNGGPSGGSDNGEGAPSNGDGNGDANDDGNDIDGNGKKGDAPMRDKLADKWKDIADRIKQDLETFSKNRGDGAGNLMQSLRDVTREKYDYTAFLKKFATMHEALIVNDEEFDYVYYTYGLRLYGKLPLVEPLEYKDVKRIRDFVIVIDTSGSAQGDLVQSFLQKTYNILKSEESFFVKFNLHIIQCDATMQSDDKITSQEEFDLFLKNMQLRGFGGTDFRPAFEYVDKLIEDKEFDNLKGLIYFTDGFGVFPSHKPPYETAFVFVNDDNLTPDVPSWAIKLVLRKNEV
ncbi:MAG: metallopeptidase [Clostridia bacterium]|nr:metallopeptidase [Clostridia bacterium]